MNPLPDALRMVLDQLPRRSLRPVKVAVVDSGIDATHPKLKKRVLEAWRVKGSGEDLDTVRVRAGINQDAYGHGTGVAGIVAALAPNARLIDIRVLDEHNEATGHMLLQGFHRAIETGARLINLSLACKADYAAELHALCEKAYRRNQAVVAAKRNMPLQDFGFPAELSTCISVDIAHVPSPFSLRLLRQPPIEFAGHGEGVMTAAAGGGYVAMTGTSFATPTITGICALLLGAFPDLRIYEIKSLLKWFAETDTARKRRGRCRPKARKTLR